MDRPGPPNAPFEASVANDRPGRFGLSRATWQRLCHWLTASVVAGVMAFLMLLSPVDQLIWVLQSRLGLHQPSGDIVLLETSVDYSDPAKPERRRELARLLEELDRKGAAAVYVDFILEAGASRQIDQDLASTVSRLGARIVFVDRLEYGADGKFAKFKSMPLIVGQSERVISANDPNWFNMTWVLPYSYLQGGIKEASLASHLAASDKANDGEFRINYGINPWSLPTISQNEEDLDKAEGKRIIITANAKTSDYLLRIPGGLRVPASYVSVYGAESLKSGRTYFISSGIVLLVAAVIGIISIFTATSAKNRKICYVLFVMGFILGLLTCTVFGIYAESSYMLILYVVYGVLRLKTKFQDKAASVDQETNLLKFHVLENQLSSCSAVGHVVVAKLHGFERIARTLSRPERAQYIQTVVERLGSMGVVDSVYIDGHNLAWFETSQDRVTLVEHLEGLRAVASAPVRITETAIDVGLTFGVACVADAAISPLAAAQAAVEDTSEAHSPILFADVTSEAEARWEISLRARIDQAMDAGEIYCVYQPKFDCQTERMTGVEALVRWHDPERGFVSPMRFIAQCEQAGRMEHLTRYVLQSACTAGRLLHTRGTRLTMAVNISATLLNDMRIVAVVREILQGTQYDPRSLILEVTETSRIADIDTAGMVLGELRALGCRLSIDDFGVGAANFETFFALPFDELKIDRVFVAAIEQSTKAHAIAASLVAMGEAAKVRIVAEGAENEATVRILRDMGCHNVQGYGLARPLPLAKLLKLEPDMPRRLTGT